MKTVLCLCLAILHIHVGHSQFTGSQQPSTDSAFSTGTNTLGTQTGGFSPFPPNSPITQPALSSPTQRNDISQTGSSLPGDPTNPLSQNGMSTPPQSNSPLTQGGTFSPAQPGLSQTGISPAGQSNSPLTQGSAFSPAQPGLSQTGISPAGQSNDPFSQTGFTSPAQTDPSSSQGNGFSSGIPNGITPQNNAISNSDSNNPNAQSGVFSPTPSNDPFSPNNGLSPSSSNSFPTTQPNSTITQNALPNQFSNTGMPNNDALSTQTGIPSSQSNGFFPAGTDTSTSPTTFSSSFSTNSTIPQPGSQSNQTSASPSGMLLGLATMLAGQYNNTEQVEEENARNVTGPNKHALIQVTYIPVLVRALGQAVLFYYEQRINNSAQPARQAIYAFSQESACLIRMSTYDIANASRFSVSPEGLQALETLPLSDLSNREECDAFWEQVDDEFFTSYLSTDQCTFQASPRVMVRPSGSRNLTCSGMTFTEVWRRAIGNDMVGGSLVPYIFKKIGNAFPVPVNVFSSNACFKVPCMSSGVASPAGPTWSDIKPHMNFATNSGTGQTTNGF